MLNLFAVIQDYGQMFLLMVIVHDITCS